MCMILLLAALWIRIYIHYQGAYTFLRVSGIAVTNYLITIYTIIIEYPVSSISMEIGVILCANLLNTIVFGLFMLGSRFFQYLKIKIPKYIAVFVASYGLALIADFLLIALIDIASLNGNAEIMKLYNFYNAIDNSGIVGIFIILFLYFGLLIINGFLVYGYLLYIHNDGRIVDIYVRMTCEDYQYYVPNDNEVSARYLKTMLNKIKTENQGSFSNPILVSILHYQIKDPVSDKNKGYTYISLYKMIREDIHSLDSDSYNDNAEFNNDSKRFVFYRHFLRNDIGAIIELDENVEYNLKDYPLLDKWPTELRVSRRVQEESLADQKLLKEEPEDAEVKEINNEEANKEGVKEHVVVEDPFAAGNNRVIEEFKEDVKQ